MPKIGILQKLCKCMLQLSEVMLLTEMLSENVHLEVLEMAGKKYFTKDIHLIGFCLFDLILYVPSTIFQLNRDRSSWVEPVLSSSTPPLSHCASF